MGDLWQEHRRFTMRHLRDLGFGKTSIEDQMTEELNDLIKDIENDSKSSPNKVVSLKNVFQVSVQNILWAIIAGIHNYLAVVFICSQYLSMFQQVNDSSVTIPNLNSF